MRAEVNHEAIPELAHLFVAFLERLSGACETPFTSLISSPTPPTISFFAFSAVQEAAADRRGAEAMKSGTSQGMPPLALSFAARYSFSALSAAERSSFPPTRYSVRLAFAFWSAAFAAARWALTSALRWPYRILWAGRELALDVAEVRSILEDVRHHELGLRELGREGQIVRLVLGRPPT